jgi:hypothetical protein
MPPEPLAIDPALVFIEESIRRAPPSSELGVWMGGEGGRNVILASFGPPRVKITSVERSVAASPAVRVRGTVLEPTAWLRGYTTEGSLGFHSCAATRRSAVVPPDFDLTCQVAPEDRYAVFDMLAAPPDAVLGHQALMLLLATGPSLPATFRRLVVPGLPVRAGLLAQFNAVRVQLGRAALAEVPAQSQTAQTLLPHYFAAAGSKDSAKVDYITLGMMAGWDVPGPLRDSQFLSFRGMTGEVGPSFLGELLFFPSNRAVLLDPSAHQVALATMQDETSHGVWGLLTTYSAFEPRSYSAVETELLDELDRQRQVYGKAPVLRVETPEVGRVLDHVMEQVERGDRTPITGLEQTLRTLTHRLQRPFNGCVSNAIVIDGWRPTFDRALVASDDIAVTARVGFYAAPGDHWGQYVSYIVFGSAFDANRGSTIPKRTVIR